MALNNTFFVFIITFIDSILDGYFLFCVIVEWLAHISDWIQEDGKAFLFLQKIT